MPNLVKSICLLVGGFAKEKTEQPATHKPHDAHVADVSWAKVRLVAKLGIDGDNLSMMRRPSQSHMVAVVVTLDEAKSIWLH